MTTKREDCNRVSVIIVNWNGRQHLPDCLDSLAAQNYRDFEIILIDNGSNDGSCEFVRDNYPWVKRFPLKENTGFAKGNNIGFAEADGDYLVTLNNDTKVDPCWLQRLVATADESPRAGMVGSRICHFDEPERIDSLGVKICADGMSRGAYRNQRFSELQIPETFEILLPSACAALYRREMIEQIGGFDEDFFAYCEDTDLGLRGRLAGWEALLARDAIVLHKYSQSGGAFSPLKLYLVERNHYWLALKNFPPQLIWQLPWETARRYFAQFQALRGGGRGAGKEFGQSGNKGALALALLKGIWQSCRQSPANLRKRQQIRQIKKITDKQFRQLLNSYRLSFKDLML